MSNIAFLPSPVRIPGANIKVVGVGGAGCNALNRMIECGVSGVQFIAMNTDLQSLAQCNAEVKIPLGPSMRGLGAGGNSERGAVAAEESRDEIRASIQGADMVFIAAGMGGGTGTGAAPVVASCASELGILAVAVVLTPCRWEGAGKANKATIGLEHLRNVADTVIVVSNEKIKNCCPKNATSIDAYRAADSVLIQGVRGISELILRPGIINVDFADVEAVLRDSREALIGTGEGGGDEAILDAVRKALDCPLLESENLGAATKVIISVMANWSQIEHSAIETAMNFLSQHYHGQPDIKLGQIEAPELDHRVFVTILASGFDDSLIEVGVGSSKEHNVLEPQLPNVGTNLNAFRVYGDTPAGTEYSTPTRLLPPTPTPSGEIDSSTQDLIVPAIIRHSNRLSME
ncbi:MAG: cell division protein FtsZ [Holophagaceae bacterium]|nr:cell division protein FtsZ [Holophagaceae bacterium]